jgi:predicted Abi (CAAX) family protease
VTSKLATRFHDVRAAIVELPQARVWKQCLVVYAAFCVFALPIGFASGFFRLGLAELSPSVLALLPLYIMLRPALLEELVFRAMLLPRDATHVRRRNLIVIASAALFVFVASHPVNAWLFRPAALELFTSPIFLTMATMLGIACTAVYLISKSLWPPVLLHWSAVLLWITILGGQGLVGAE